MNHTPGPWTVGTTLLTPLTKKWTGSEWEANEQIEKHMVFAHFNMGDQGRGRVCVATCNRHSFPNAQSVANTVLLAAAPDMLEALRWAERSLSVTNTERDEVLIEVRKAITKATAAPAAKDTDNG